MASGLGPDQAPQEQGPRVSLTCPGSVPRVGGSEEVSVGKGQLGQEGRYKEYVCVFVCVTT